MCTVGRRVIEILIRKHSPMTWENHQTIKLIYNSSLLIGKKCKGEIDACRFKLEKPRNAVQNVRDK